MSGVDRIRAIISTNREDLIIIVFFILLSYFYLGTNISVDHISTPMDLLRNTQINFSLVVLRDQIVAPMDLLLRYPGWSNSGIEIPLFNAERSDVLDSFIPQWNFARDTFLSGSLPLWNPFRAGGHPAIPEFSSSLLTPSFFLFFIFGGGIGFTFSLLVKSFFAGYGTYKLCRTELTVFPSIFGGIAYMMCGFNACWLMWPHVTTSMWIPWILWGIIQLYKERTHKRIFFVAIPVALLVFGGFPFVIFCGLAVGMLLICWLVFIDFIKKDWISGLKSGFLLSFATVAGIGLAAIQILPFAEWAAQFDTSWRHGGSIFSLSDLDILFYPLKYRHHHIIPKVEWCGYIGILTLLFAIIAVIFILKNKKKALTPLSPILWILVIILVMIPLFKIAPLSTMFYQLPILNMNPSNRLLVILALSFSIMGAYGFDVFEKAIKKLNGERFQISKRVILLFILIIIGIQILTMAPVGMVQNAVVPGDSFFPNTHTISYVQDNLLPGQSVLATSTYFISGTLSYYDISDWFAHGYHRPSEKAILNQVVHDAWKTPTAAMYNLDQINLESPYIDKLGIRYVLTSEQVPDTMNTTKWQIMSLEEGIIVLENLDCPPGAYLLPSSDRINPSSYQDIFINKYSPNYREYTINTIHEGVFVTTTRIWPGWVVYCNGQTVPIKPYMGMLQSIDVPEGESVIQYTYVPYMFYCGLAISIFTLIILLFIPRKLLGS